MYDVNIYIPVYFREEQVKKSIKSLFKTNINYPSLSVRLFIGINGIREEYRDYFNSLKKTNKFKSVHILDFKKNLGKPKIINEMAKDFNDFDYLVSMDSDIEIIDKDWLYKILKAFYEYKTRDTSGIPLGALCLNQEGNCVHQAEKLGAWKSRVGGFTYVTTARNNGVAGGILVTPKKVWDKIGGFRADNIYGSDDGAYAIDCDSINHVMAYVEEIKCYHPFEPDEDYNHWKLRACNGELSTDEKGGYYENLRQEDNESI